MENPRKSGRADDGREREREKERGREESYLANERVGFIPIIVLNEKN